MTIAVSVKVHDGLVLAADSATTLMNDQGAVVTVYNNANKVFNLHKGLPIAGMTWGAGAIGMASISTLAKDLRRRLTGAAPKFEDWKLDPETYTIKGVADLARKMLFEELYKPLYENAAAKPAMGFMVAGYSAGEDLAEIWQVNINGAGDCSEPELIQSQQDTGISWNGEPEALSRLVLGHGTNFPAALLEIGVSPDQLAAVIAHVQARMQIPLYFPPMPIKDAIDLAEFLVTTTVLFSRFTPGAATVGGPIELAAITKHEGFKWVSRKHYFEPKFNSKPGGHHE